MSWPNLAVWLMSSPQTTYLTHIAWLNACRLHKHAGMTDNSYIVLSQLFLGYVSVTFNCSWECTVMVSPSLCSTVSILSVCLCQFVNSSPQKALSRGKPTQLESETSQLPHDCQCVWVREITAPLKHLLWGMCCFTMTDSTENIQLKLN